MATLTLKGNTKRFREALKRGGWKWQPTAKTWTLIVSSTEAEAIAAGDVDAQRAKGLRRPGCICYLSEAGSVRQVFRSEGYSEPAYGRSQPVTGPDYCDQHGNYIGGERIHGSAPDDLI